MTIVLGIDTGGTYTDGVVLDLENKQVLAAAKAVTTHYDLVIGIRKAIERLELTAERRPSYAALSTTLATNAVVEGQGCRVGLLLLGFEPQKELPDCRLCRLPGAMDILGCESVPLDEEATRLAIEGLRGQVDAVAVSGFLSVRNPEHEKQVKAMVRAQLGLPVVAAHELASTLGVHERTVTAVLNARLLHLIDELMAATKCALGEQGLDIPLMIVKGDGSLMTEGVACERPIETILSGPTASIIGTTFLHDTKDALVLDMGGTTTDIAVLKNGRPRLDDEGALVGGWRTRVAAAEVSTFGLGGDSRVRYDHNYRRLAVGPRRCLPLCVAAVRYPQYLEELRHGRKPFLSFIRYEPCDGVYFLREPLAGQSLSERQQQVIAALADGAHTISALATKLDCDPNFLGLEELIESGVLGMISFTPTDLLHLDGRYVVGEPEGARIGLKLIANEHGLEEEELTGSIEKIVTEQLCRALFESALAHEKIDIGHDRDDPTLKFFFDSATGAAAPAILRNQFVLDMPVVGIGAPVRAWLPAAAEKFHTPAIFPEHNDVANAIGAAAGEVMTIYRISVQNHDMEGVIAYAPWGRMELSFDEAMTIDERMAATIEAALAEGRARLQSELDAQGLADFDILTERRDIKVTDGHSNSVKLHIETQLALIATGRPHWDGRAKPAHQISFGGIIGNPN